MHVPGPLDAVWPQQLLANPVLVQTDGPPKKRQLAPSAEQPERWPQMPTGLGAVAEHVPLPAPGRPLLGSPPQQSALVRQRSPSTRQPVAGWQTETPVV
jgi:hypothetical protein